MRPAPAERDLSPLEALKLDATRLGAALDEHIRRHFAPDRRKTLRSFSAAEAAHLLGVTTAHLRTMRHRGKLPDVGSEDSRRSLQFTAEEIDQIRQALGATGRKKDRYLPRRSDGEALQVVAVSSFKGGSGKTSVTAHLAAYFALAGYRVLVIDLDPQASLSTILGIDPEVELRSSGTIYDAIRFDEPRAMSDVVQHSFFHNIDIAPAGLILSEFEQYAAFHARDATGAEPWFTRLSSAIQSVEGDYDLVLIDCPPSLGFLTLSAMVAATGLLVPVVPNMIDVASLAQFTRMSSDLMEVLGEFGANFDYDFVRYVITRHEPTDAPQAQLAAFLRMQFESRVLAATFLKSTVVADAGMTNQTIYEIRRSDVTRTAYDRARESFDAVGVEVETLLHRAWGRE